MQDLIEEEIKNLKNKIKEIYYIKEYDTARDFDEKLEELKEEIKQIVDEEDEKTRSRSIELRFEAGYEQKIMKKIEELNDEIDQYMVGIESKIEELNQRNFETRIRGFIQNIKQKDSTYLINELNMMVKEAKEMDVDDILFSKLDELSSKALLGIFIEQIKKGENIDFNLIKEITEEDIFINEIQEKLIEISESVNEEEALKILNLCKELNANNLNNNEVWAILSGTKSEKEYEEKTQNVSPSTELAIRQNKKTFWQKLKEKFLKEQDKTTKYIFEEFNEQTGQSKYIVKYNKFPISTNSNKDKRFMKKCEQECIGIEINDQEEVHLRDIMYMINLNDITFGKNVRKVYWNLDDRNSEMKKGKLKYDIAKPRNIKFSNDVEEIIVKNFDKYEDRFQEFYRKLEYVEFGRKIKNIPDYMLCGARKLEEVKFPEALEEIGKRAFFCCKNLKYLKLPKTCKIIRDKAFKGCELIKEVIMNGEIEVLEDECFENCYGLQYASFGDKLESIGRQCFHNCKLLTKLIVPNSDVFNGKKKNIIEGCENINIYYRNGNDESDFQKYLSGQNEIETENEERGE